MSQFSRHRFAYAPLRDATRFPLKAQPIARAIDWHARLEGRSAAWFDALAMTSFALVGVLMTWHARTWIPGGWWNLTGSTDAIAISIARVLVSVLGGVAVFVMLALGARLGLFELPGENRLVMAAKFAVAALLGCGALMLYHDPLIGLFPVIGLTMLALILLFRSEPSESFKASLAIALFTMMAFQTLSLI